MSASTATSATLPQPTFSFIHVLQLVQPVSPSSPYRLPSTGLGPGQILPSRLAKTEAPFPTAKPTDLNALYQLAVEGKDKEELRRERNRKKKERKLRNKQKREADAAVEGAEKGEGEDEDDSATATNSTAFAGGLVYGLPSDIPPDLFMLFEAHYHRNHHAASRQREAGWAALNGANEGKEVPEVQWGDIVLHDAVRKVGGKRDTGKGGFVPNVKTGKMDFHWVV
ncbi:hypothetical protein JCM11251_007379 [Rhodosporidiobolus azoricus]